MGGPTILSTLSLISIYQYLNVNYTANVVIYFQYLFCGNPLNFVNIFANETQSYSSLMNQNSTIQGDNKFNAFQVTDLFLMNAGGDISVLIVLFCIALVVSYTCLSFSPNKIPGSRTSNLSKWQKLMIKIKKFFLWNLILSYFIGAFVHILFSVCLQYRYLTVTKDLFTTFSILMCTVAIVSYLFFMGFLFYRSKSTRFSSDSDPDTIDGAMILSNEEQQADEKSLSENLKNRHWALVLCSRNFVLTSIIATLSDTPVIQCALSIAINFAFFIAVSIWKFSASRIKRIIIMIVKDWTPSYRYSFCYVQLLAPK